MHVNIDVNSRRLIAKFPGDEVKCIAKLQSHCAYMTFDEIVGMTIFKNKSHIEEGSLQ